MNEKIDLRQFSSLRELNDEQQEALLEQAVIEEYGEGDYIFHEGASATHVCFILQGKIDIEVKSEKKIFVLDQLGPGDLLGWSACLGTGNSTASSFCQSHVRLVKIEGTVLREILHKDTERGLQAAMDIARIIARRLRESRKRLTHLLGDMV